MSQVGICLPLRCEGAVSLSMFILPINSSGIDESNGDKLTDADLNERGISGSRLPNEHFFPQKSPIDAVVDCFRDREYPGCGCLFELYLIHV